MFFVSGKDSYLILMSELELSSSSDHNLEFKVLDSGFSLVSLYMICLKMGGCIVSRHESVTLLDIVQIFFNIKNIL